MDGYVEKINKYKIYILISILCSLTMKSFAAENLIISVPNLPLTGAYPLSWGVIRSGFFWDGKQTIDFSKLKWPAWDTQQIPLVLVPATQQETILFILDDKKEIIEKLKIDKPFSPEAYLKSQKKDPYFYQVKLITDNDKIEILSEVYPWYRSKKIAQCHVELKQDANFDTHSQIKVCLKTLKAYLDDSNTDSRNIYLNIKWPRSKNKEQQTQIKTVDRDLKKMAAKRKSIFVSEKNKTSVFHAELGLTQIETLPQISFPFEEVLDQNFAMNPPAADAIRIPMKNIEFKNNANLQINSMSSDIHNERTFESPNFKNNKINLQVTNSDLDQINFQTTLLKEQRTGILGQLRRWQLYGIIGYNFLSSNKGENIDFLSFPSFEAQLSKSWFDLNPYFYFNKDLFKVGSRLQITELKMGATRKFNNTEDYFYSLGYLQYSLSGENTGASRLGEIKTVTVGLGATQKIENWRAKEEIYIYLNNESTFDYRVNLGHLSSSNTDESLYLGAFAAYNSYQANVFNKINNKELLGENRFQIGIKIGWLGADSF
jgi:hypothetical protein